MPTARHILIVNSRSVHQPVFVVGAPHSGADLIGRALKASAGFHLTIGQPACCARCTPSPRPSCTGPHAGRRDVIRDTSRRAGSHGEQLPGVHQGVPVGRGPGRGRRRAVRRTAGPGDVRGREPGPHLLRRGPHLRVPRRQDRPGDQGRPGRGASMLADPVVMSWFRPSFVNVDTEFPNPFFGIEDPRTVTCGPVCPRPPAAHCAGAGRSGWPPAAPQPAGGPAEDHPLRAPAQQAGRGAG